MMRRRSIREALAAAGFAVVAAACSTHPVNLGPDFVPSRDEGGAREIRARACGFNLGDVIPIQTQSLYQRAFNRLREQAPSGAITDVHVQIYWRYAVVGLTHCAILKAKAYPKAAAGSGD